jgi:glutathione peroxidase
VAVAASVGAGRPFLTREKAHMRTLIAVAVVLALPALVGAEEKKKTALDFKMKGLDGKQVDLSKYKGKVVLFVNVASECGLTKQYKGLQKLHDDYAKDGLVIVGVPANEFNSQEPGTDKEIRDFCTKEYGVKFVMLSKVVVRGKGITPLYKFLTEKETNPDHAGEIKWNFTKFLVGRDGTVVKRFEPAVQPTSKPVVDAIKAELKKKEK